MTKDKTNDFIKVKMVKQYISSINKRTSKKFLERLKTIVRTEIDNFYKPESKTETVINETICEVPKL